jgi:hypothetical protein
MGGVKTKLRAKADRRVLVAEISSFKILEISRIIISKIKLIEKNNQDL